MKSAFLLRLLGTATLLISLFPEPTTARPQIGNRIELDVVALDDHNQPVRNLSIQDFHVSDNGKDQQIADFSPIDRSSSAAKPIVLVLFDLLNANQFGMNSAQGEIIQSLEHSEISDSTYLYLLANTGNLLAIHGLPDSDAPASPSQTPWTQQIRPLLEQAVNRVFGMRPMSEQAPGVRTETTFQALEVLGSLLAQAPDRKNIIWITHGVPGANSLRLRQIAAELDGNNITLNSVERGDQPTSSDIETLREFAALTGGSLYDSNLDKILAQIIAGARVSYRIAYAAPIADGKYHKVRVTCSRKGVRIQTKQGYYAH